MFIRYLNSWVKWGVLFALVCIYIYPNLYNMMSLDYTGYAHIANQLNEGNWAALFNLTWSSLMSFFASILMRIGVELHLSFAIIKMIFLILSIKESQTFIDTYFRDNKTRVGLKLITFVIVFFLSTSNSDILFYYFSVAIVNAFIESKNFKFVVFGILLILTRPLGLYLVIFLAFVDILQRKLEIKSAKIAIYSYLLLLTLLSIWAILMGKHNGINPTIGWTGKYNLTLVSPENQKSYSLNYDEKYKQLADVYHEHMLYDNNTKDSQFYSINHNRRIDQWKWLDISYHVGKSIPEFNFTFNKLNIIHFTKWYFTNFYIFFKDYIFILVAVFFIFKQLRGNDLILFLGLMFIAFAYLSLFFLTHIESRYILAPIFLLICSILYFNDGKWFNNFQFLVVFNILFFKQWIQIMVFFVSGMQNLSCKIPFFLNQKFNQKIKYVSTGNLPPSLLVIKNPNLKCVGYIKSRDDFWKIQDTTIALLEFKTDTAYFTYRTQNEKK